MDAENKLILRPKIRHEAPRVVEQRRQHSAYLCKRKQNVTYTNRTRLDIRALDDMKHT